MAYVFSGHRGLGYNKIILCVYIYKHKPDFLISQGGRIFQPYFFFRLNFLAQISLTTTAVENIYLYI